MHQVLQAEWREVEAELLLGEGDTEAEVGALEGPAQLRRAAEPTIFATLPERGVYAASTLGVPQPVKREEGSESLNAEAA